MTIPGFFSPFGDIDGSVSGVEDSVRMLDALGLIARQPDRSAPVVLWIARSARLLLRANFPIASHVTIAFAPGAVLTIGEGATVDVEGRLDIGPGHHFDVAGGRLILRGPLDEIDTSWWSDGRSGGASVDRALDVLWDRYGRGLPPAPITITGSYRLEETLRIVPPESLVRAFPIAFDVVMRGRHRGLSSPMTFQAGTSKSAVALDALVQVDGRVVLTLENIGFDLTRPTGLPAVRSALLLAGDHDRSRLEACTFRLAEGTGVHITALWDSWREAIGEGLTSTAGNVGAFGGLGAAFTTLVLGTAMLASVTRRASRVSVVRCDFEGGVATSVGVRVDVVAPTMLDVSDCLFRGEYDRGITFVGADLMVTNTNFDNTAPATTSDPLRAVDIFLGSREALPDAVPRLAGANAQLTATHCVSTSPTFLAGRRVFNQGDSGGAVLTSVLHQPRATKGGAEATSIHWMGPYDSRSLVLQGCELGASVRFLYVTAVGVVVELGTRFAAGVTPYVGAIDPMVGLEPP